LRQEEQEEYQGKKFQAELRTQQSDEGEIHPDRNYVELE